MATTPKSTTLTQPKVGIVSLGCPKALVDSERIITRLRAEGYAIAPDYKGADLVLVNTCGFLDSARAESLDAIGEAINENGKVIVTGCLGAEANVITERHPGVLAVTGPHQYEQVMSAVHDHLPAPDHPFVSLVPESGVRLTPRHYAYLKISEGCNNRCSFCIIPGLRGDLVSRRIDAVLREAEQLVNPLCLPVSARGRRDADDGGWAHPPLSRHPVPAFQPQRAEGDAAAGEYRQDGRSHCEMALGSA